MIKFILIGFVTSYGIDKCRDFTDLKMDLDLDRFAGEWYPIYQSKSTLRVIGQCPVWYYQKLIPKTSI
jgi:hypothetical protein